MTTTIGHSCESGSRSNSIGTRDTTIYPMVLTWIELKKLTSTLEICPGSSSVGIDERDYAYFNSDNGIVADPALKWDVTAINGPPQIEIWPIPASNNQYVIWRGIRALNPLIALTTTPPTSTTSSSCC